MRPTRTSPKSQEEIDLYFFLMALNIKDVETDRLARELAGVTGESITEAIRTAVEERLRRVRRQSRGGDDLRGIITRGRGRPLMDARPETGILGYGADGLPT